MAKAIPGYPTNRYLSRGHPEQKQCDGDLCDKNPLLRPRTKLPHLAVGVRQSLLDLADT